MTVTSSETTSRAGIVSYGIYTPGSFETREDIAKKSGLTSRQVADLGIERKHVPGKDDQPVTMAVKAAENALEKANRIDPRDVDLILWTGEEYKDYIAQTASIRLQEEIGCRNAWAFDLVGQGVTLLQGLRLAGDMMIGDESITTVLLAGGTRNIDLVDYRNPDTRFLLASSASGVAVILQRGYEQNCLMNTSFFVDSSMADEVYVPGGGTEHPFSEDILSTDMMFYRTAHPDVVAEYLAGPWTSGLIRVIRQALAGHEPDYLALRHLSPSDRKSVLDAFHLNAAQSASLVEWGPPRAKRCTDFPGFGNPNGRTTQRVPCGSGFRGHWFFIRSGDNTVGLNARTEA